VNSHKKTKKPKNLKIFLNLGFFQPSHRPMWKWQLWFLCAG